MPAASSNTANRDTQPVSLRSSFAWTFAGNAVYGAGQWAILSLIAKLGSAEMLGQYAFAVAVITPAVMLSHLNLRAVLATDMDRRHPFGDYVAVRLWTSAAALAAVAVLAAVSGASRGSAGVIVLAGVAQVSETVSDLYYGALQRRERMNTVAQSMMARAILSAAALGAALWISRDLLWAVAALAAARIAVLLGFDRPRGLAGDAPARSGLRGQLAILRMALPLGIVLMLGALNANLPRYAIERSLGTRELGAFAAVASFMAAGASVVNALGQAATPRLARHFSAAEMPQFRRLTLRLSGVVLALGAAGIAGAALCGSVLLRVLYRPEYAAYAGVLIASMAAAVLVWLAAAFGYVVTSARSFHAQVPLFCAVAAASGAASWVLVPRFGLYGAVGALAAGAGVQIGGEWWILARAAAARTAPEAAR